MEESIVRRFSWSREELISLLLHDLRARGKMEGNPEAKLEPCVTGKVAIELHYHPNKPVRE